MFVDPNKAKNMRAEHVLVHPDRIELHDGRTATSDQIVGGGSAFHEFCGTLDPNLCFISALVPDDAAKPLFYAARDQAREAGVHMQAGIEEPERQLQAWRSYCTAKKNAVPEEPPDAPEEDEASSGDGANSVVPSGKRVDGSAAAGKKGMISKVK